MSNGVRSVLFSFFPEYNVRFYSTSNEYT